MISFLKLLALGDSPVGKVEITDVNSIAELRAIKTGNNGYGSPFLEDGSIANVDGYYSQNDGGGGVFIFSAYSSATDDGGVTIAPTSGLGRWIRQTGNVINVRHFGAKGNAVADDANAIQSALDTAHALSISSVFFPAGIYYVTETLYPWHGTVMRGENSSFNGYVAAPRSRIVYNNVAATDYLVSIDEDHADQTAPGLPQTNASDGSYILNYQFAGGIEDLVLDASPATLASPLHLYRVAGVAIRNVALKINRGDLFRVDSCNVIEFVSVRQILSDTGRGGIVWSSADIKFSRMEIGGARGPIIHSLYSNKNVIVDSFIFNAAAPNSASPVANAGTDEITIAGNRFVRGTPLRFAANGGTLPTGIAENTVYYAIPTDTATGKFKINSQYDVGATDGALQGVGIDIQSAGVGNWKCYEVSPYGTNVQFTSVSGSVVSANRFDQPLQAAITLEDCFGVAATGNNLSEAGHNGSATDPNVLIRGCTDCLFVGNVLGKIRAASQSDIGIKVEKLGATNSTKICVTPNVFYNLSTRVLFADANQTGAFPTGNPGNGAPLVGTIGEIISSTVQGGGTAIPLTTATLADVTYIDLTPGIWEVTGLVAFALAGATTTNKYMFASSATSVTLDDLGTYGSWRYDQAVATASYESAIPTWRYTVAAGTTKRIYLIARATFSAGTVSAYGTIQARRIN